jgi:hypothetical protein
MYFKAAPLVFKFLPNGFISRRDAEFAENWVGNDSAAVKSSSAKTERKAALVATGKKIKTCFSAISASLRDPLFISFGLKGFETI